jgi:hypothetical protein
MPPSVGVWLSCNLFLADGVFVEFANNPELFWLPISTSHKAGPVRAIKRIRRGTWQGGFQGFSRSDQCILSLTRGSFQKFCTLYIFSSKMNLFYKIHLQAFNLISTLCFITVVQRLGKSCIPVWTPSLLMQVWWAQPSRLWLVPKIEETTPWETLQKHWGGV